MSTSVGVLVGHKLVTAIEQTSKRKLNMPTPCFLTNFL